MYQSAELPHQGIGMHAAQVNDLACAENQAGSVFTRLGACLHTM